MARKVDHPADVNRTPAHPDALKIVDWDEGAPSPQGWFGIEITYRRERSADLPQSGVAPLRAVLDDFTRFPRE
jgi:hypothetical protein